MVTQAAPIESQAKRVRDVLTATCQLYQRQVEHRRRRAPYVTLPDIGNSIRSTVPRRGYAPPDRGGRSMSEPLADQDLSRVDAYWRVAKKSKRSWSTASAGTSRAAPSNPASSPPRTMATARKLEVAGTRITARVSIGTASTGGDFALAVALDLEAPQLSQEDAAMLMTRAHE